jgi:hypothetical protein
MPSKALPTDFKVSDVVLHGAPTLQTLLPVSDDGSVCLYPIVNARLRLRAQER